MELPEKQEYNFTPLRSHSVTLTLFIPKKQVPAALSPQQALKTRIKKLTASPL
jgi:hypothetical protein